MPVRPSVAAAESRRDAPVLVAGFSPFGGARSNPSADAVRRLASTWAGPEPLVTTVLPVTFADAAASLLALVDEHAPRLVVATGLADGRGAVTPERVAVNLADARIPDNAGAQPLDEPVVAGGPAAYFSTLPVKAISAALDEAGHPAAVSHSAGTFVCNHVFYALLHHLAGRDGPPAGFVHLPAAEVLPVEAQAEALAVVLRTALDVPGDLPLRGGTIA